MQFNSHQCQNSVCQTQHFKKPMTQSQCFLNIHKMDHKCTYISNINFLIQKVKNFKNSVTKM